MADEHVVTTNVRVEVSEQVSERLLADERIDGLFCVNGLSTAGPYQAAQRLGHRMPDDLALIGVDNDHWARLVNPQVGVIVQPIHELAEWAAEPLARAEGSTVDSTHVGVGAQADRAAVDQAN
ncbi:substrate-binding domain-containing protein [Enemella dayhoffiae]|uniref:substrate-binding domain-containing protein n=1 Tax=Enemella dayhoffiae TaxID=2016507 RepID=UPI00159506CE|nr:substrate-binding domain-containing protein [Enemella dayhoffiae]